MKAALTEIQGDNLVSIFQGKETVSSQELLENLCKLISARNSRASGFGGMDCMEWNGGMERWNGTVEWNTGMPRPLLITHDASEEQANLATRRVV